MENGKWKMENGKWKIKNRKKEKGEWKKGNMRVQELNRINGKGKWNRADGEGLPLNFDKVGEFMLFTKENYEITKVTMATQHLCSSNICSSSFYWIYTNIRTNIFFLRWVSTMNFSLKITCRIDAIFGASPNWGITSLESQIQFAKILAPCMKV
jgi:hypothetical protein